MSTKRSFRNFSIIWGGQFLSVLGSGISSFGLSVWLFEQTGAATPFAMSFLCSVLPSLLLTPVAGSFADRKSRKKIIMLTDSMDAILKLVLALLLFSQKMQVWMVYPIMVLSAICGTFQGPAFSSSIPMLLEEKDLSKANGMRQLSSAAQNMLAPILAGALYPFLKVQGLLLLDLGTYFFAFITIALIPIPQPVLAAADQPSKNLITTALSDFRAAFRYLRNMPQLFGAILVFSVVNFIANLAFILLSPMILATYSTTIYSLSQTISGISMLAGALLASLLPVSKNQYATIYGALIISGLGLLIGSISSHWLIIFCGVFVFCLWIPYVNASSQTLIQTTTEASMLGRVNSAVNVLCQIAMPISALIAGPLADQIFGPMMMPGGVLAESFIGKLIGIGPGRGCGFIFLLCGLCLSVLCTVCLFRSIGRKEHNKRQE